MFDPGSSVNVLPEPSKLMDPIIVPELINDDDPEPNSIATLVPLMMPALITVPVPAMPIAPIPPMLVIEPPLLLSMAAFPSEETAVEKGPLELIEPVLVRLRLAAE